MVSNLEALKKKKAMLLKRAGMKTASIDSLRQRRAEEAKLKAEIFALENPGSAKAKEAVKRAGSRFGRFIKERSQIVVDNAVRIQAEKNRKAREERDKERELEKLRLKAAIKRKTKRRVKKKATRRKRR